ncbi:MAG: FAD-dependent oxidoreductase [Thermoprotei archaeon]|nr:MAG: FAD-dependent oxidoreductase [Thermoprotei archaeon]
MGGWLKEYIGERELRRLIEYVDSVYVKFGAPDRLHGTDEDLVKDIERRASIADLKLIPQKIRHLGTENCAKVLQRMRQYLERRAEIKTTTEVHRILVDGKKAVGVELADGERVPSRYVVVAPGRAGAEWLVSEATRLGLKTLNNPVDVGVRVEVPAHVTEELTEALYEPKLIYYSRSFDDMVRTFCFAPHGFVIAESHGDIITVNGQSYANKRSDNTNFALLVSTTFTKPFKNPIAYGKYLARLANLLSGGIIIQRLGDLITGRRSTEERIKRSIVKPTLKSATPGDLSFALPYRYLTDIREMLEAMDKLAPGIYAKHTMLYGVEVKFYSSRMKLSRHLETEIKNLFAIGDGAGITRGLMQASISGVVAASEIRRREGLS